MSSVIMTHAKEYNNNSVSRKTMYLNKTKCWFYLVKYTIINCAQGAQQKKINFPFVITKIIELCKYLFLPTFLGDNSSGLVLSVWMIEEFRWTGWNWTEENGLLEVVEQVAVVFRAEGDGQTSFSSTTGSTDTMRVIWNIKGKLIKILTNFQKILNLPSIVLAMS